MNAPATPRELVNIDATLVQWSPQPGRPLLLLLRMASRGMGVWDTVWDGLAKRFSVAQFDLEMPAVQGKVGPSPALPEPLRKPGANPQPGGPSPAMDDPSGVFRRMAARCADVATHLGHPRFHVLGWNGGTHVALRCALEHAARVESCILLGPFHKTTQRAALDKGVEFLRVMLESGDRELYAYYWFMSGLSPRFVVEHFDRVEAWVRARVEGDRFLELDSSRALQWIRALRLPSATDAELASVRVPTLVVAHSEDRWHAGPTVEMACNLAARVPSAKLEILEGYGSLVLLEAPEVFLRVADAFHLQHRAIGA